MTPRTHIVLVPGFFGFDALGQLEYYAGVTALFEEWRSAQPDGRVYDLHYVDSFPTASVALRADRLCQYLLKRVARGELNRGDRVALIGHSTGGLDIRKAVYDLAKNANSVVTVDALSGVRPAELLANISHLVFVSVPHFGTNLADVGWTTLDTLQAVWRTVGLGVQLNREPVASLRRLLDAHVDKGDSDLLRALSDALNESDENPGADERQRAAEREARSELALWLEHMGKDSAILSDLRSASAVPACQDSPAHYSQAQRLEELALWRRHGISTQSYRGVVNPQAADAKHRSWLVSALKQGVSWLEPAAKLLNAASGWWWFPVAALPAISTRAVLPLLALGPFIELLRAHPDALFKALYLLCADPTGPFRVDRRELAQAMTVLTTGQTVSTQSIAASDNDGIVNTLSTLWPYEPAEPERHPHFIVEADHGDIIGHYALHEKVDRVPRGRRYDAYDIFPSGSGFDSARFKVVWQHIFNSCR